MCKKIKNRHRLKKKEIRNLEEKILENFDCVLNIKDSVVETGIIKDNKVVFVNNEPCFILKNSKVIFTIFGLNRFQPKNKYVIVDMGAVKFVTNGADVMAPGIVDADESICKGDQVWICDSRNKKPLAVGFALVDGTSMKNVKKGKAVDTFLYVGDSLWNYLAKSL